MGRPAARLTDNHTCPMASPMPHVAGPVTSLCVSSVKAGNLPMAVVGSMASCTGAGGAPDAITTGSSSVLIGDRPAARVGDFTAHGGTIAQGLSSVLIGGASASPQADALSAAARAGQPFCET